MIILSDIHANWEALTAVLACLPDNEDAVCLGDVVGYGPEPALCLEILRSVIKPGYQIMGNHEKMTGDDSFLNPETVHPLAIAGIRYTRDCLNREQKEFIAALPIRAVYHNALLVHGAPPDSFLEYLIPGHTTDAVIRTCFSSFGEPIGFVGHSHRPGMWILDAATGKISANERYRRGEPVSIQPAERCIINTGSVGQPRDGDHRAAFCRYDESARTVQLIRVDYDCQRTRDKIIAAGLPHKLGDRLALGR